MTVFTCFLWLLLSSFFSLMFHFTSVSFLSLSYIFVSYCPTTYLFVFPYPLFLPSLFTLTFFLFPLQPDEKRVLKSSFSIILLYIFPFILYSSIPNVFKDWKTKMQLSARLNLTYVQWQLHRAPHASSFIGRPCSLFLLSKLHAIYVHINLVKKRRPPETS